MWSNGDWSNRPGDLQKVIQSNKMGTTLGFVFFVDLIFKDLKKTSQFQNLYPIEGKITRSIGLPYLQISVNILLA